MSGDKFRVNLKKAFSLLEYALLIAILVAALMAMAVYIKRAVSGRWRSSVDESFGQGRQYEPNFTSATGD